MFIETTKGGALVHSWKLLIRTSENAILYFGSKPKMLLYFRNTWENMSLLKVVDKFKEHIDTELYGILLGQKLISSVVSILTNWQCTIFTFLCLILICRSSDPSTHIGFEWSCVCLEKFAIKWIESYHWPWNPYHLGQIKYWPIYTQTENFYGVWNLFDK